MITLGVPDFAAHMFIFYYALLSEVSPPTALSCFAAAALTGGNPYKTTMMAWKYTLPAFLFPFTFVLDPSGVGLLLKGPVLSMLWVIFTAFAGIFCLAAGVDGWFFRRANIAERVILIAAGLALVYPSPFGDGIGFGLLVLAAISQKLIRRATSREQAKAPTIST
jgi:TRAP-type uncharacterized transport system fused permease subunit